MTSEPVDRTMPAGRWTFDEDVTDVFDNMLRRSIPDYGNMRRLVLTIAETYAARVAAPVVVDLGCSHGESIAALRKVLVPEARFHGVDASEPMVASAQKRFCDDLNINVSHLDLRAEYPSITADVTLSVLTLQFVPLERRQNLVRNMFLNTRPGGILILVEKVLGASSDINRVMVNTYEDMKAGNGYTAEQIDRKRASLEGVLVPLTAKWNEALLHEAGFSELDCFWRWMNFMGILAVRPL